MKIKIAHLYYDLLNLYGENGNIIALINAFSKKGLKTDVDLLTVDDKKEFDKYDLLYIGSGNDEDLIIALNDLKKDIENIKKTIKKGTFVISTGNSRILFGKSFELNKEKIKALNIFDYYAKDNNERIVGESIMKFEDYDLIGFQNRSSIIYQDSNYLFKIKTGHGNNKQENYEGFKKYNFYSTYLLGPIFIRNPKFTEMIINEVIKNKKAD